MFTFKKEKVPKVNKTKRGDFMEKLLNRKQAADILGVSMATIIRLQSSGEIVFAKIGGSYKISETDLNAYYNRRKIQPRNVKIVGKTNTANEIKPIGKNRNGVLLYV